MKNLLRLSLPKYSPEEIHAVYSPLLPHILEIADPLRVILFGSAVTGDFDSWSDLDFVVVLDDEANVSEIRKRLYRLRLQTDRDLEFICVTQSRFLKMKDLGGVLFVAAHEGTVLYESIPAGKNAPGTFSAEK